MISIVFDNLKTFCFKYQKYRTKQHNTFILYEYCMSVVQDKHLYVFFDNVASMLCDA